MYVWYYKIRGDFEGCGHMQMLRLDQLRFLIKWPLLAHASKHKPCSFVSYFKLVIWSYLLFLKVVNKIPLYLQDVVTSVIGMSNLLLWKFYRIKMFML